METISNAIELGWPILSILTICSLITIAAALQCWSSLKEGRRRLAELGDRNAASWMLELVDKRLAIIGTIANAAPFIGLLGTVIGIIRGFHTIATTQEGGLGTIAGSISEALVSTGAGLAVAITASVFFNYFTFNSQILAKKIDPDQQQPLPAVEAPLRGKTL